MKLITLEGYERDGESIYGYFDNIPTTKGVGAFKKKLKKSFTPKKMLKFAVNPYGTIAAKGIQMASKKGLIPKKAAGFLQKTVNPQGWLIDKASKKFAGKKKKSGQRPSISLPASESQDELQERFQEEPQEQYQEESQEQYQEASVQTQADYQDQTQEDSQDQSQEDSQDQSQEDSQEEMTVEGLGKFNLKKLGKVAKFAQKGLNIANKLGVLPPGAGVALQAINKISKMKGGKEAIRQGLLSVSEQTGIQLPNTQLLSNIQNQSIAVRYHNSGMFDI